MNTSTQQLYDRCKANPYMSNDAEFMEALRQMVKKAEKADQYREAIATVCEGWTLPDAARKILETALWADLAIAGGSK